MLTANGFNGFVQGHTRFAGLPLSYRFTYRGQILLLGEGWNAWRSNSSSEAYFPDAI